jgi:hypothetical protein
MSTASLTALRVADQMNEAFRSVDGFSPSSLMASAVPKSTLGGRAEKEEITRAFHYYRIGSFSSIQLHGAPQSTWVRLMAKHLRQAGYKRMWKLDRETGLRRWLSSDRERTKELAFLRDLGETGPPKKWPKRVPTVPPVRARRAASDWHMALAAARAAGIIWNACAVGFSRRTEIASVDVTLEVSAIAFARLRSGPEVAVDLRVSGTIPPSLARGLNQELRRLGYRKHPAKNQIHATRKVRSVSAAARECVRVFARLSERASQGR